MFTRIIGDIHGDFLEYKRFSIHNFEGPTIQVGDFGIGFGGPYWHDQVNGFHNDKTHRFIRGNHDDPTRCKEMVGYIPDGTVENTTMFIGGAWSIDYAWRTPGINWWQDEECSIEQFNQLIDVYAVTRPKVMITHDCPSEAAVEMFQKTGKLFGGVDAKLQKTRTASALQAMYEIHQPDIHIFGHWHHTCYTKLGNTHFMCLGEFDYIDINLDNIEESQELMRAKVAAK